MSESELEEDGEQVVNFHEYESDNDYGWNDDQQFSFVLIVIAIICTVFNNIHVDIFSIAGIKATKEVSVITIVTWIPPSNFLKTSVFC